MKPTLLIKNIGCLLTPLPVRDAAVVCAGEKIAWAGPKKELPKGSSKTKTIDAHGALVTPGLIDCHTHLVFAGSRADEFFARLNGDRYELIAQRGGGIAKTVACTREAPEKALLSLAKGRLDSFLKFGVTTVEAKSGYGLSQEGELKILRVMKKLKHAVDVIPTFLGAHVVPKEFKERRDEYIDIVCDKMLPRVKREKLSNLCDVFCEAGAFTIEESRKILSRARDLGFQVKIHADQLTDTKGAELAVELGALSADHLEQVDVAGIRALAKSGTIAVLLPGAVFFLGKRTYPPARKLLDAGAKVAISTDLNPGTSYTENLPLMMSFAAVELKMTVEEIWSAVTVNAARACGLSDRGRLTPGCLADLVIWDAETPEEVPYHYGSARPTDVIKRGLAREPF